eukprot:14008001-Ditylum_brightwellii.AAC.1
MNNMVLTNRRQIHIAQPMLPSLVTVPIHTNRIHVPKPSLYTSFHMGEESSVAAKIETVVTHIPCLDP